MLGGLLLRFCIPIDYRAHGGLGFPTVDPRAGVFKALGVEIIGTFTLVFMVFALAVDKRAAKFVYAMCIGGSLGAAVLAFGPISGAALNPARWFGPCLIGAIMDDCDKTTNNLSAVDIATCNKHVIGDTKLGVTPPLLHFWIYLAGPLGGGVVAALMYRFLFLFDQPADDEKKTN